MVGSNLRIRKLSPNATIPVKGTKESAGFDLSSAQNVDILPGKWETIYTDLRIGIPDGCYGRIAPRSGLASGPFGIDVYAGVVDRDYTGNVAIVLKNNSSSNTFTVKVGDKIAQLICEKCCYPKIEIETEKSNDDYCDDKNTRGQNGFGSTGIKGLHQEEEEEEEEADDDDDDDLS